MGDDGGLADLEEGVDQTHDWIDDDFSNGETGGLRAGGVVGNVAVFARCFCGDLGRVG